MGVTGTCQVCGRQVAWRSPQLGFHKVDGEVCAGTGRPPVEALEVRKRPPSDADRAAQRVIFGDE